MSLLKRTTIAVIASFLLASWTVPANAADNPLKIVLEDAVYGGVIGTLLGAATIAFTDHKSDHIDNIGYGAAIGIMAGAGFGLYTNIDRSLVEYENGKVKIAMPTVIPKLQESSSGQMVLALKADLLRGSF